MGATLTTIDSALKEFYLGPIVDQLNQEALVCELMEKTSFSWNGQRVVIPIYVSRNTGVASISDGGSLPTAGNQGLSELHVNAKYVVGRFQLTGPAIAAAKKGDANSFASWSEIEMDRLAKDIKDFSNRRATSGGRFKGWLTQHSASTATSGVQTAGNGVTGLSGSATGTWIYDGDFTPFADCSSTDSDTFVRIQLYRMDTYAEVVGAAGATNPNILVVGSDSAAGTLSIVYADSGSTGTLSLAAVGTDYATAVALHATQPVDDAAATAFGNLAPYTSASTDPIGMYGNLADPTHFTVDRTTASGQTSLQSLCVVADGAGTARTALASNMFQKVFDRVEQSSGERPDMILMNHKQRQRYASVTLDFNVDASKQGKGLDGGFSGFSYAGVPIKTSRHVDNGLILFAKKDSWKMAELQSFKFEDIDGAVLSRVAGSDAFEGMCKWYYNVVCTKPNANAVLVGLSL